MQDGKKSTQATWRTKETSKLCIDSNGSEGVRRTIQQDQYQSVGVDRKDREGIDSFIAGGEFTGGVIDGLIDQSREQLEQYKQRVKETEAFIEKLELLKVAVNEDESE